MRLLERNNSSEFSLAKDFVDDIPRYAILSHTWGEDTEEVTFKDLIENTGKYRDAAKCYVYLSDVSKPAVRNDDKPDQVPWESAFRNSTWFT
jgi:hypothetical protein